MSAPGYDSYKESGVDWLGDVPSHWSIEKFRHRFRESSEKIDTKVVGPMLSVSGYRGIEIKEYDDENRRRLDEELAGYRIVRPGQLVVNTMWLNYAGLGVSAHEGHVSPAYRSYWIRPGLEGRYTHHLMRSSIYVQGYTRLLTGIRPNSLQMSRDDLMEFPVVVPPLAEQAAIAAFLDRETGKIDALVEAQTRLIELLKEKRQAVISHAVTKGLDPAAPMKNSGVEWLGQVPAHWEVTALKKNLTSLDGKRIPLSAEERGQRSGPYPYYGASGVIDAVDDYLFDEELILVSEDGANLINRSTPIAFVASGRYWVNNHAHVLRPEAGNAVYWAERIEAIDLVPFVTGSAQPKLTSEALFNLVVAVPPTEEERSAIQRHVLHCRAALEPLLVQAKAAVSLLQERRSALISAAVTGRIDVRQMPTLQSVAA